MTRTIAATVMATVELLVSIAGFARTARAQTPPRCEAPDDAGDRREFTCALGVSAKPRQVVFKANFSGSHDDTMASLSATLDGKALPCDAGSKTDLMGEDGDVSLQCRFTLPVKADAPRVLKVALSWRHAQYTGYELEAD